MTDLDSVLKTRDNTLLTKVSIVKAMVFPVVMYSCESWTMKKAESRIVDAIKLWWWKILLNVPWTASISRQSILKEINPEYSLEGLMLKLKLQYFVQLMLRADSLVKTLVLGKTRQEEKGAAENETVGWHYQLNGHMFEQTPGGSKGQGSLARCSPWGHKE